jgi:hypothetical protein
MDSDRSEATILRFSKTFRIGAVFVRRWIKNANPLDLETSHSLRRPIAIGFATKLSLKAIERRRTAGTDYTEVGEEIRRNQGRRSQTTRTCFRA